MKMNETPSANRLHIAFFGRRNAGKSSLVNAFTGQNLAIVSEVKGTTTDPVSKAMELLPLGPVVIIDTPGYDDEGDLGNLRVDRSKQVLNKTDIAVLVLDGERSQEDVIADSEAELIGFFMAKMIPHIIVLNKCDISSPDSLGMADASEIIPVSAKTGFNINLLKEKIAALSDCSKQEKQLVADLIRSGDFVVLVMPIDKGAPKGRLILPQQQMIRGILEAGAAAISVRETELEQTLEELGKKPAIVITDSQVFSKVSAVVPTNPYIVKSV